MTILQKFEPLLILVFLAFSATVGLVSAAFYMDVPFDPILSGSLACITFMIYCINKYTDKEDDINKSSHHDFFSQTSIYLVFSVVLLVISVIALLVTNRLTAFHFFIIIVGVSYSVNMVPYLKNGKWVLTRLKDICVVKSVSVAIVWSTSFFVINWLAYPEKISNPIVPILFMACLSVVSFMDTVFCDVLDMEGDMAANIKTIPTRFGQRNTYIYAIFTPALIFIIFSTILFILKMISIATFIFFMINMLYPVFYTNLPKITKLPKRFIGSTADLCWVLFSGGLVLLRFIK